MLLFQYILKALDKKFFTNTGIKFFHAFMKSTVSFVALALPLLIGYAEYSDSYRSPKWAVFLSGIIMGLPFSLGLWLSTIPYGKKHRIFTLTLTIMSAIVQFAILLPYESWITVPILLIELYAIYSLLFRDQIL